MMQMEKNPPVIVSATPWTCEGDMLTSIAGYEFRPKMWMVRQPIAEDEEALIENAQAEVFSQTLSGGLRVFALRCGVLGFDFSYWPAGNLQALPTETNDQTLSGEDIHKLLSSVKLHRAMLCNIHLACLYTTLTQHDRKIKATQILGPNDLLSLDKRNVENIARAAIVPRRSREIMWSMSLRDSVQLLDDLLQRNDADLLAVIDLYAHSIHALDDHNYGLAVSLAWTVTEKLLLKMWHAYVDTNRQRTIGGVQVPFINEERKKVLLAKGGSYTASVKSEILSLLDVLPFDIYGDMKTVRQGRNDWMHSLKPATLKTARQAVDVARRMLAHVEGIDLLVKISARLSLT